MPYDPKYNEAYYKYRKEHMKRVGLDFAIPYFEEVLLPAVKRSGMTISGFIKTAIDEKLSREKEP